MAERILPDVLLGVPDAAYLRKLREHHRQRTSAADSRGQCMRKLIEQDVCASTRSCQLHVVVILKEVQDVLAVITFRADRNIVVLGRSFGGVDAEGVLGLPHVVDVYGQLGCSILELLMHQALEVVEQVNVRSAVYVLIQRVRFIESRWTYGLGVAGEWFGQQFRQLRMS